MTMFKSAPARKGPTRKGACGPSADAKAVRAGVLGEREPLDRLAASLYNRPALPTFTERCTGRDPWGQPKRGTKFLRWHELSDERKDKVRASLRKRLDELDVDMSSTALEPEPAGTEGRKAHKPEQETGGRGTDG